MVLYSCETCNFSSKIKTHYNRHLKTQKHKKKIKENEGNLFSKKSVTTNDHCFDHKYTFFSDFNTFDHKMTTNDHKLPQKKYISDNKKDGKDGFFCDYCNKKLSTKGHLTRHIKNYCLEVKKSKSKNEKTVIHNLLEEQKNLFDQERKYLYTQIEKLLDKVGNTTINNTQNIQLNNYGKEDLSHISDKFKTSLLKIPYGAIPKMIEAVHFNDKKPENKNISLTNVRDNKIKVFTGNKWVYKNKDETINELVDGKYYILDTYYDNKTFTDDNISVQVNYEKFRKFYEEGDKELVELLKKECELVLLNNR